MKDFWNTRYASDNYVYGTAPNSFFKSALEEFQIEGSILLPAEGEGRNAVYAAIQGLEVSAFDISIEGQKKALLLAQENNVQINYAVGGLENQHYEKESFDAAALIFAHFPSLLRSQYHKKIAQLIKPAGHIIIEGFEKEHGKYQKENPNVGGPKNIELLLSITELKNDFSDFDFLLSEEKVITLDEGQFHQGEGKVVRLVGVKK